MKAFTKYKYGGPEVLQLEEVEKPVVKDGHILVKVVANSANPADWHIMRGEPVLARLTFGLLKPREKILGADFAGVVEAVGANVTEFKVGHRVFGGQLTGAFAEYVCTPVHACALMPASLSFSEMAAVPVAGLTAIQAIVTHGKLQQGESVLVNGSSGGVGHFTVQLAKAYGGIVTAVCSAKNADFVKSLGADHVIIYDQENIHQHSGKYDLVIDTNGNLNFNDFTRMGKRGVVVGFTTLGHMIGTQLAGLFSRFKLTQFTSSANPQDLTTLATLMEQKKIRVHIEKTFPASEIPQAIGYIESMRTRGKVVMEW